MSEKILLHYRNLPYTVEREINDLFILLGYIITNQATDDLYGELYLDRTMSNKAFSIYVVKFVILKEEKNILKNFTYSSAMTRGEFFQKLKYAIVTIMLDAGLEFDLPWGILTGVRPVKLAYRIKQRGCDLQKVLHQDYLVSRENVELLKTVLERQEKFLPLSDESVAIYIHIPYCPSRCLYCSFPSGIMPDNDEFQQNFCLGVEEDIAAVVQLISMHGLSVNSVYIGGGTPTSLSDKYFARLIAKAAILLDYGCDVEFTVEAGRPDTFSLEKLVIMKEFGVDRISINSQTMHERTLALIGRNHSIKSLIDAVNATQRVGIKHINMDLIIGLPNETVGDITYSVREVLDLEPDNFTVHTLALKNGAPLYDCQNKYSFIGMQEVEQLLTEIKTMASKQAYFPYYLYRQHYMLSQVANIGFAKDGTECLYNIIMMGEYGSVIGAGPGAATKILAKDGYHLSKLYLPKNYGEYQKKFKQLLAKREKMFINRYEWGNR